MAASCSSLSTSHSVSFVDHDLAFGDHVADVRRDGDEDLVKMAIDLLVELGPHVRAAPEADSERECLVEDLQGSLDGARVDLEGGGEHLERSK